MALPTGWDARSAAVIVCDMWDAHHCVSAANRVVEMAPRMNQVIAGLREQRSLIIHAPSACMDFYAGTAGRERASSAPHAAAPLDIEWNEWDGEYEGALPPGIADPGHCSCGSPEPCCEAGPPHPWTRQIESIDIDAEDAISDDGQEVFNLLQDRGIDDVVMMGVHTNICVLGRPFGIRQLVYLGKSLLLCRDLTDSFHRDEGGHFRGTELIVRHIEKYWCPTITSDQLVGGVPFQFEGSG